MHGKSNVDCTFYCLVKLICCDSETFIQYVHKTNCDLSNFSFATIFSNEKSIHFDLSKFSLIKEEPFATILSNEKKSIII